MLRFLISIIIIDAAHYNRYYYRCIVVKDIYHDTYYYNYILDAFLFMGIFL